MSQDDIAFIERSLRVELPPSYKEAMTTYAHLNMDADWSLVDDIARVIMENNDLRSIGFFGLPWPENYFYIGDDGAGNIYFLDLLLQEKSPVYWGDHENRRYSVLEPNFRVWALQRMRGPDGQAPWDGEPKLGREP